MTPLRDIFFSFARIGLLSFGGPAAQIALMHRTLVQERKWLSEQHFLRALSFCMLLPGPEAMQLATYAGWRLRGTPGGLIAGCLFVLPGAIVIACLALAYAQFSARPETAAILLGIKASVIAIIGQALYRLSRKALHGKIDLVIAGLAFVGLFVFSLPFPLLMGLAALWGALRQTGQQTEIAPEDYKKTRLFTVIIWVVLWLTPLPVLWLSGQTLLFDLAAFFAKLAVVTFGGAYAVLAYMAQEVVEVRGWLTAPEMIDALGLAETSPGPLILVTQFVGQLTGQAAGGTKMALAASALTLWMTFVPCFLWIFALAPHVENLLQRPRLQSALSAITAAVVGVIANLSLWFGLNVLFTPHSDGLLPDLATLRLDALALVVLGAMLLRFKTSVPLLLAICAAAGWGLGQAG
ncbi:chromate transporter [Sagittula marina]|uniref:Chromate transporter n=1 Tax=Sagittula marina TaxID=943940 RepID=A0A7W6DM00_9RHOB|nr:chromate efflux transporter [Sagittula marina]MBB3985267.1 chromate transporter [Sagittula marina]